MKVAGIILVVLAYIVGIAMIALPMGLGLKTLIFDTSEWWATNSRFIITGIVAFVPLYLIGDWLRNRAKKREKEE